jgi:DNA-binding protein HU-beta
MLIIRSLLLSLFRSRATCLEYHARELIRMAKKETPKKDVVKAETVKKDVAAPTAKKSASVTLTTTEIGEHLATTFEIPKSHAKIYLAEAVALIGKHLKKGNKVRISGLGVFQVKKRAARKGRNPNTGEAIKIKASKRIGFAVARDLKAKL